jgi:hypothetical protein
MFFRDQLDRRLRRTAHDNRSTTIFTVWPVDQLTFGRSGKPGEFRGQAGGRVVIGVTPPFVKNCTLSREPEVTTAPELL